MPQADSARLAVSVAVEEVFGVNPSLVGKVPIGSTNAAPIVMNVAAHGYPNGHVVNVAGHVTNTNANGVWEISVIDANNFALIGSQGNGVGGATGTVKAAAFQLPITGEGLKVNVEKKRSAVIRSDRQGAPLIVTGISADGPVNFELMYREFDYLMSAVMQNTWNVFGHRGVGAVIPTSATFSAGNVLTAGAATVGASDFTKLAKGQWVKIIGSAIGANNIVAQLSKTVAPTNTVLTFEQAGVFTNGAGGVAVQICASRLTNGLLPKNFAIEKAYADLAQIIPYNGMPLDGLELNFSQGDIANGSLSFMGKKGGVMIGATALDVPQALGGFESISSVTGVQQILANGAVPVEAFLGLKLKLANNARKRMAVGSTGPVSIGYGRCLVSGSVEAYLTDGTRFSRYINNTPFAFSWAALDSSGNGYIFTVPRARFNDANPGATQADQDVTDPGAFDAEFDSAGGCGASSSRSSSTASASPSKSFKRCKRAMGVARQSIPLPSSASPDASLLLRESSLTAGRDPMNKAKTWKATKATRHAPQPRRPEGSNDAARTTRRLRRRSRQDAGRPVPRRPRPHRRRRRLRAGGRNGAEGASHRQSSNSRASWKRCRRNTSSSSTIRSSPRTTRSKLMIPGIARHLLVGWEAFPPEKPGPLTT
jgi:hypothetical protein